MDSRRVQVAEAAAVREIAVDMDDNTDAGSTGALSYRSFIARVLIVLALVVLLLALWLMREAFLLAFASVLVATVLLAAGEPVQRWTGLSRIWSISIAGAAILAVLALVALLVGAQIANQWRDLSSSVPEAAQNFEERFGIDLPMIGPGTPDAAPSDGTSAALRQQQLRSDPNRNFSGLDDLVGQVTTWGTSILTGVASLILVVVGGAFFAADPETYRRGLVLLFPKPQHARADSTLRDCGRALRLWLLAQLVSMSLVGLMAGLGTWAIGLQAPLALGLFAGVVEFVPIFGPIAGAVPAVLLALTEGTGTTLWTIALYLAIQQVESNMIMPLVERRIVEIPPGLFLFAVVAAGLLFGLLGVLLAGPLTVAAYVIAKRLYIRDTLGESTSIPGRG